MKPIKGDIYPDGWIDEKSGLPPLPRNVMPPFGGDFGI